MTTTTRKPPRKLAHGVTVYDQRDRNGRWRVVWTNPHTGKKRSAERSSELEALEVAREVVAMLDAPRPGAANQRRKMAELVAYYLDPNRPDTHTWSAGYRARQDSICRTWVLPHVGELRCQDVTPDHLKRVVAEAARAGRTAETLHTIASTITGVCTAGREAGFFAESADPAAGIRRPIRKVVRAGESGKYVDPATIPSTDQADELAAYMGERWEWWRELQANLATYTGLRLGELLPLRPVDLNLKSGQIDVLRAWSRKGQAFTAPKWGRQRTTFLIGSLLEPLERRCAELDDPNDFLFPRPSGGLDAGASLATTRFNVARRALGWPRHPHNPKRWLWTWHSLRHTFCTWCLATPPDGLGLEVADVAYFAGHHSPEFTMSRYVSRRAGAVDRARAAALAIGR